MTEQKPFRVETSVEAPQEAVWRALTTPEQLRDWFGWDYSGIEAETEMIFGPGFGQPVAERLQFDNSWWIDVVADGSRTIVRAVAPGPLADTEWDDVFDAVEEGWRVFLEQLRYLLEIRPTGRRRTIYLTGETTGADLLDAAGPGETRLVDRYHRIAVNDDGHLVAAEATLSVEATEPGPVSIVVSTFGLDDDAFAAVRDQWAERWRAVAKDPEVTT